MERGQWKAVASLTAVMVLSASSVFAQNQLSQAAGNVQLILDLASYAMVGIGLTFAGWQWMFGNQHGGGHERLIGVLAGGAFAIGGPALVRYIFIP